MRALWIILAMLLALVFAGSAMLPEVYDYRCYGQRNCAAVPDAWVHENSAVVVFRIPPGGHPMYGAENSAALVIEVERFRLEARRLDGRWHLCLNTSHYPLCVYPPGRSF